MDKDEDSVYSYPGWEHINCICSGGLRYDCLEPTECGDCNGAGVIYRHIKSGVLAEYPGGPFLGRDPK